MVQKLKLTTPDLTAENIAKIAELFPNAVTEVKEGEKTVNAIDRDILKQLLSDDLVEGPVERYRLERPGKRASLLKANKPISETLRPVREESKDWDTTENLYLEGDNFQILKILQESYLGKIKMIYIDPPYNTGKDFVYKDNFRQDEDEILEAMGGVDEDGGRLVKNTDTNARYHSDWLSMMYERLIIARDLLTDDGVIFMSIDDNEVHNLRKIADEVFGEDNFVDCISREKKSSPKGVPPQNMIVNIHEYILTYSKTQAFSFLGVLRSVEGFSNPDNDPRGPWRNTNIKSTIKDISEAFTITNPETGDIFTDVWAFSKKELQRLIDEKYLIFPDSEDGQVRRKEFFNEFKNSNIPIISSWGLFDNQSNTEMLRRMMEGKFFQNPKPINLIKYIIEVTLNSSNDIILDFFSGSATTAHAVMALNAEDGGNRKWIMAQLPELTDEKSEAYQAGYKTITEIGKERIRRAGAKILEEHKGKEGIENLDTGFRVYRVDSSNMKETYYQPSEIQQEEMGLFVDNIKEDRTGEDLLTQVILDLGLTLDLPMETKKIGNQDVYFVGGNHLIACFDENISTEILEAIAKYQPLKAVFRDKSFETSQDLINLENIIKNHSPHTDIHVL